MSARPWLDVAVMTRAPAADAPTQALIAECSDSTVTYSVWTRPSATNLANSSTIVVCGVMGYAAIMSGAHWRIASATRRLPVVATVFCSDIGLHPREFAAFRNHLDSVHGAFVSTDAASLAVVEIEVV